jgi:hypothetical protein
MAERRRRAAGSAERGGVRVGSGLNSEYYTSPEVVQAIWQAMERLGLQPGAQILEPSMGVGHFFGLMPENLYPGTRRTGVELDSVTARIATKLYPESTVHGKAFEDTPFPKDYFDAAVGNIPFGNYPVYDPGYRDSPHLTHAIHDYFLAKCLDVVRPGGVMAVITSRYTMDKQDSVVRRHLAEGSILLGTIRLPNTTFKANAGTEVTTDILFLQKRSSETAPGETWSELRSIETADGSVQLNEYYARHPEMMLGRMGLESGQYGDAPALLGTLHPGDLEKAVALLPASVYRSRASEFPLLQSESDRVPAAGAVKEGGLAEHDGQIVVRRGVSPSASRAGPPQKATRCGFQARTAAPAPAGVIASSPHAAPLVWRFLRGRCRRPVPVPAARCRRLRPPVSGRR